MKKLTRKGQICVFGLIIVCMLGMGFFMVGHHQPKPSQQDVQYETKVIYENKKIISTYVDSISREMSSTQYKPYELKVDKGYKIGSYVLSQDQTFEKYVQLKGPQDNEVLSKKSKEKATHYAYTMLLTGDVIEKTNSETKEKTYMIVNGHVTYDCIPLALLSNENSVHIVSHDKKKDKVVNLQDFISALKDIKLREKMLSW